MIEIKDLHKSYKMGHSELHVLKGINFNIKEGELVAIMGSSGSGKSTLLNILGILDEADSGLDIDALKIVAAGINKLRDLNRAFILITHYQRLLDYIVPDKIHVLANGRIIKSGTFELAKELEKEGYAFVEED